MPGEERQRSTWERQKHESRQAYAAFCEYLNEGAERSYARVGQSLGKSKTLIERWGSRWQWQMRVTAYEEDFERRRRESVEKDRLTVVERQVNAAQSLWERVVDRLESLDPNKLSSTALSKLLEVAARMERQAMRRKDELEREQRPQAERLTGALRTQRDALKAYQDFRRDPKYAEIDDGYMRRTLAREFNVPLSIFESGGQTSEAI